MELPISIVVNGLDEILMKKTNKQTVRERKKKSKKDRHQTLVGGPGMKESRVSIKEVEGNVDNAVSRKQRERRFKKEKDLVGTVVISFQS